MSRREATRSKVSRACMRLTMDAARVDPTQRPRFLRAFRASRALACSVSTCRPTMLTPRLERRAHATRLRARGSPATRRAGDDGPRSPARTVVIDRGEVPPVARRTLIRALPPNVREPLRLVAAVPFLALAHASANVWAQRLSHISAPRYGSNGSRSVRDGMCCSRAVELEASPVCSRSASGSHVESESAS